MVAPISAPMLQMVAMPVERENPQGWLNSWARPPYLLKMHTRLCTRKLASLLPSLSLPLWSRVKRMAKEKEATGLEPSVPAVRVAAGFGENTRFWPYEPSSNSRPGWPAQQTRWSPCDES